MRSDRLNELLEISTLLTSFGDVAVAHHEIFEVVARALPLHDEVLVWRTGHASPRILQWCAHATDEATRARAIDDATKTLDYLVHRGLVDRDAIALPSAADPHVITLPLVVSEGLVFGVVRVACTRPIDEDGLKFANTVVNQLAIALDRQAAIDARQAAARLAQEQAEWRQRVAEHAATRANLLAAIGEAAAGSLDERQALAAVVERSVVAFADLCIADAVDDDGTMRRICVEVADAASTTRERARALPLRRPARGVTRWTQIDDTEADSDDPDDAASLRALGAHSMIVAPLAVRDRMLGALTFVRTTPGRGYDVGDVLLAQEIAHRAALAIDNARLYRQAQQATRDREQVLSVVAHDLRNPLGVILTSVDAITRTSEPDRRNERPLEIIRRSAWRMNRIIEDLLDAVGIEQGRLSITCADLPVAPLIEEIVETHAPLAEQKAIALSAEVEADLPPIWADAQRVHQIFGNLVGNALKFTPSGGTITLTAETADDHVRFSVADSGPGIAPENIPHVFDRHWQADRAPRSGAGLGLFIVRGIVAAHGGTIDVDSRPGRGTTFRFSLPIARLRDPQPVDVPPPRAGQGGPVLRE